MSENGKMMTFDEFRAAAADKASAVGESIRRQLEHLRQTAAADELLRPEYLEGGMGGWVQWPDGGVAVAKR